MKDPEASDAASGLLRTVALERVDTRCSSPALLASYNDSALGGLPIRLAWSADGTYCASAHCVFPRTARWPRGPSASSPCGMGSWLPRPILPSGRRHTGPGNPRSRRRRSPRSRSRAKGAAPIRCIAAWAPRSSTGTLAFRLGGEVVGEAIPNPAFVAGTTYSWSPFAMGALGLRGQAWCAGDSRQGRQKARRQGRTRHDLPSRVVARRQEGRLS